MQNLCTMSHLVIRKYIAILRYELKKRDRRIMPSKNIYRDVQKYGILKVLKVSQMAPHAGSSKSIKTFEFLDLKN